MKNIFLSLWMFSFVAFSGNAMKLSNDNQTGSGTTATASEMSPEESEMSPEEFVIAHTNLLVCNNILGSEEGGCLYPLRKVCKSLLLQLLEGGGSKINKIDKYSVSNIVMESLLKENFTNETQRRALEVLIKWIHVTRFNTATMMMFRKRIDLFDIWEREANIARSLFSEGETVASFVQEHEELLEPYPAPIAILCWRRIDIAPIQPGEPDKAKEKLREIIGQPKKAELNTEAAEEDNEQ